MGGGLQEETYIIPPGMDRFYPETGLLGRRLPAQGLFARHVDRLTLKDVQFDYHIPDKRPFIWLGGVGCINISRIKVPLGAAAPLVYEPRAIEAAGCRSA
jgi:hypothetical protein